MHDRKKHFLAGCSFTDPCWQDISPWSICHGQRWPSYVAAKAGMGIKGICTEALYWLDLVRDEVDTVIVILPNLFRYDIEVDQETYLCNAMVNLLSCDQHGWQIAQAGVRKWIVSGGLNYQHKKPAEMVPVFDFLYRHQGFLVIVKEHLRALERLIDYCQHHKIRYIVSTIQDPLEQLDGLDYIRSQLVQNLHQVGYDHWLRFDGHFIDKFLGHPNHPTAQEHEILARYIENYLQP